MRNVLGELAADVLIFLAAMLLTTGACAKKVVSCDGPEAKQAATVEAGPR